MIKFKEIAKRKFDVTNGGVNICSLDLVFSPATNKFTRITDFIEDCSIKMGDDFDNWFVKYVQDYINSDYDYIVIKNNIPEIKKWSEKYLEMCNINFDNYINKNKISKNSIFFDSEEIKKMIMASNYLKLYFIFSQDINMKLPIKFHKEIYGELIKDISDYNILFKLYKIVSAKTYKYNITDSYMWEYLKNIYCKTTDMHIITIFNFILNNILVTCNTDSNPIPYITSVIDESINWILKSVYNETDVYGDIATTEDINPVLGRDNLQSYSYNDTIGRLVVLAYTTLGDNNNIKDTEFDENIKTHDSSLIAQYLSYPILCKVLNIPYRHLMTIPAKHSYLMNILLFSILPLEFKKKYPTICDYLLLFNKERAQPKTSYKIKNINHFLKTNGTFLGFKNIFFCNEFYSDIIGKISRNTYASIKTGQVMNNTSLTQKLELELVTFYNDYFDNRLDGLYTELENKIDSVIS